LAIKKHTSDEVIKAIGNSYGIKSKIAERLGVHRHTLDRYLDEYATARQAYLDEVERVGDWAETNIITAIKEGNLDISKWYAGKKLQNRGYVERQEVTGADNGPLNVVFKYIDDADTDKTGE
jgi:hypothetical protein